MMGWGLVIKGPLFVETCLRWIMAYRLYLRPGECDKLLVNMIVRPQLGAGPGYQDWGVILSPWEGNLPGKAGLYDEAVIWDMDPQLGPLLGQLIGTRGGHLQLWSSDAGKDIDLFSEAATAGHLDALKPTRYSLRHGGASHDLLSRQRSLAEVMKRGRWLSDQSLRRYAKETRILDELNKLPPPTLSFGISVAAHVHDVLLGLKVAAVFGPCPP